MTPKMCVISMTTQLSKPMRFMCMDVIDGLTEPLLMGRLGHQLLTSYQMVGLRVPPGKFSNLLTVSKLETLPGGTRSLSIYFILSSEINVYQKWIKVIFSLQN